MSEIKNDDLKAFKTRPYQQKIIDVCIKKNSIVYLPTGSGKSYIALQVIKHFSKALETKYSDGGMRSIFLCNTVCLAKQQVVSMKSLLPYEVALLTGEQNVDEWIKSNWDALLEKHEILVATAQVVLDAIRHAFIKLNQINVIIFDECHHARKDHPMHELMKMFRYTDVDQRPRVVGLSGMLIGIDSTIKPETVETELQNLENTFEATIVTVSDMDDYKNVLVHSTKPKEGYIKYSKSPQHSCVDSISATLQEVEAKLKKMKLENYNNINPRTLKSSTPRKINELILFFKEFHHQAEDMGPYGGYLCLLSILIQFELLKRRCDSDKFRNIVKFCITVTEQCIHRMQHTIGVGPDKGIENMLINTTPKVRKLIILLKQKFCDPLREKDLQCIVFVQRRFTAKVLYHLLKIYAEYDADFPIKPDFMVGINNELPESIQSILNTNFNDMSLEKFKNQETNCIVSSSVLEEGIDLQMCNLVVMYDSCQTFRAYVQTKGRARITNSYYIVMVQEEQAGKFLKKNVNYNEIDVTMRKSLIGKTIDRSAPTEEDIEDEHRGYWDPFVTPISKSVLSATSCVSLLHRYAQELPSDRFTNNNIQWERTDHDDDQFSATLILPTESSIKKPVQGKRMRNIKMAKQHAAFLACIQLFENGELDDNLLPVDSKKKIEQHHDEYFAHWKKYSDVKTNRAGKMNMKRYHQLTVPAALENCSPKVQKVCYLYRIFIRPKFDPENDESIKVFHELLENSNTGYGILMYHKIPKLCAVTLFQSFGEIELEIAEHPIEVTLKDNFELESLQKFHTMLFRDVLKAWKTFFVFVGDSYLVVPLDNECDINWKLVQEFPCVVQPEDATKSYDTIKKMQFKAEDYLYKVVNPMYRSTDQVYVVTKVHEHMSPMTAFPNEDYDNYKNYVESNYDVRIHHQSQFLIEVKGISKNLNLFFPGGGQTGKLRRFEKEKHTEFYVPEICHNFHFPADYWLKSTLLPCLLHRMHYMILAENIRNQFISSGIDFDGPQDYTLDIDHGSYDQRKVVMEQIRMENESYGVLKNIKEMVREHFKENAAIEKDHRSNKKAPIMFDKSLLPKDIDRNWLSVTDVDMDYLCSFLSDNQKSMLKLTPLMTDRLRKLCDSSDRMEIKLLQLNSNLKCIQQKHLIKALTTSGAGDVFDMERFEVLGDGFLKFIVSLFLFKKYINYHEGHLTSLKGQIVSNRNLFYCGNDYGLSGMVKKCKFQPRECLPPSIGIPRNICKLIEDDKTLLNKLYFIRDLDNTEIEKGRLCEKSLNLFRQQAQEQQKFKEDVVENDNDDEDDDDNVEKSMLTFINQHYVGDKIIADAVESLIGVVVSTKGIDAGLKVLTAFKILPTNVMDSQLLKEKIPPRVNMTTEHPECNIINRAKLESIIKYKFKNPIYLVQALTHASYPVQTSGSYQKLEFLGDAVLDFLVTSYIFERCVLMDPGKLTDLRSSLVNNVTLACIVVRNGLHKFLLAESVLLIESIRKFVKFQDVKNHEITDQIMLLDTEDDAAIAETVDVPKVLGDILESIIGAIFLDSDMDLTKTWTVIYGLLQNEIHEFMNVVPKQIVRRLFEYPNANPKFYDSQMVSEDMTAVPVEFSYKDQKVVVIGYGKNRSLAKKAASKLALQKLESVE